MMGNHRNGWNRVLVVGMFTLLLSLFSVSAATVHLANSNDWKDVYSVMLSASLDGEPAFFVNSESITSVTRLISPETDIVVYESRSDALINNLEGQLGSAGYDVIDATESNDFNFDLVPEGIENFILIAEGNYRISVSVAPYAVRTNSWVFIVNDDNLDDVIDEIDGAGSVTMIGAFGRNLRDELEPYVTRTIDNNNIYEDSQEIASEFPSMENIVLSDGSLIEAEFFSTNNPVVLSGYNKILDESLTFLRQNGVKTIVIVGNRLAVVGEQIRTKSNKQISVFVKYGQTAARSNGEVYALLMFALPQPEQALTISEVVYNPIEKQLIAYFKNLGNVGLHELTTLRVVDSNNESIGDASSPEINYIGAGETVPVAYALDLPVDRLEGADVIFFTSFGTEPSQLDTFLTMVNKYGPPFSIPLTVQELDPDDSSLVLGEVAYHPRLKRIGVELVNNGSVDAYVQVNVQRVIVNGLEEDLSKTGSVKAGETETVYIPVELDSVDIDENEIFDVVVLYGQDEELLLKTLRGSPDFISKGSTGITGFVVSNISGTGSLTVLVIIIALLVVARVYIKKKRSVQQ